MKKVLLFLAVDYGSMKCHQHNDASAVDIVTVYKQFPTPLLPKPAPPNLSAMPAVYLCDSK